MFDQIIKKYKLPSFRLKQLNHAYYKDHVEGIDEVTTLSKDLRAKLADAVDFQPLKVIRTLESAKKDTVKFLFQTKSGRTFETVLMMHEDNRNTVCVSCMQGCPVGCQFCATGKLGYNGNLTADEMVAQVLFAAKHLKTNHPERQEVSNVVFMGMGEPMLNFENIWRAYEILTDPDKFGLSKRRVTISTSGFIKGIEELIKRNYKGRLAISLHAPNQQLREKLMSNVAKSNPLDDLIKVLDKFEKTNNKRITYEYILIDNLTDTQVAAEEIIKIFKARLAHFNLIPYNPVSGVQFKRPGIDRISAFENRLKQAGIPVSVRVTMGDDIQAACGQLAGQRS